MLCTACKSEISEGASLCKECNTYQSKWRNWIPYVSTGAALITFILAGMSYIVQVASKQFAEWTARDQIQIAYLNSRGTTSYLNSGDNEVILMREELNCFGYTVSRGIYKSVVKSNFVALESDQPWRVNSRTFSKEQPASSAELLFFDKESLELKSMKEGFRDLKTFPATGTVTFFSTHDEKQKKFVFECVCIIVEKPDNDREQSKSASPPNNPVELTGK
jgi:hypothetical protein